MVRIWRTDGPGQVAHLVRLRAAGIIYPGEMPTRRRPRTTPRAQPAKAAAPPVPPTLSAIEVDHDEALAFFEKRRPTYDRLVDALAPHLDREGIVLDVGGNIGFFSKVLVERGGFGGTVHLYEPLPHLSNLSTLTLAGLPVESVVHPHGLGTDDVTTDLYVATDGNLGWNTLVSERAAGMTRVEIELRRFDPATVDGVPSLVKIDVEGAEHQVLQGLMPALRDWSPRPVILCEIGWGTSHPDWDAELEVFDEVMALGYEVTDLDGEPLDLRDVVSTTDVLFVPATTPA